MERDARFYRRWTQIRGKGKGKFVFSRGLAHGLFLYAVWAAATWLLDQDRFTPEHFVTRYYYYLPIYMIVGFIISNGAWNGNNKRYDRLTKVDDKERRNLP